MSRFLDYFRTLTVIGVLLVATSCATGVVQTPSSSPVPEASPTQVAQPPDTATPEATKTATVEPLTTLIPARPAASLPIVHFQAGEIPIIQSIHMQSPTEGWAVGVRSRDSMSHEHVLWTEDGGHTWIDASPFEDWVSVEAFSRELGAAHFAADRALIQYRGSDLMWRLQPGVSSRGTFEVGEPLAHRSMMAFVDDARGWLMQSVEAGMGTELVALYRTVDEGNTWDLIVGPDDTSDLQSCFKTGMKFQFALVYAGWVSVDCQGNYVEPFLLVSQDIGSEWTLQVLPVPAPGPESPAEGYCYSSSPTPFSEEAGAIRVDCLKMVGDDLVESSYLYFTDDGGESWTIHDYPGGQLEFFDDGTILSMGRDLYRSNDGGATWTKFKSVEWDGQFSFTDSKTGWAVATNQDEIALVHTTDGGATWEIIEPVIRAP